MHGASLVFGIFVFTQGELAGKSASDVISPSIHSIPSAFAIKPMEPRCFTYARVGGLGGPAYSHGSHGNHRRKFLTAVSTIAGTLKINLLKLPEGNKTGVSLPKVTNGSNQDVTISRG